MKSLDQNELLEILKEHGKWISSKTGKRANLCEVDLRDADLRRADLREANLCEVDLRDADLRRADLRGANLREADLREADLRWADLRWANLRDADLRWANLCEVDLRRADLRGANLCEADLREADLREVDMTFPAFRVDSGPYSISFNGAVLQIGCKSYSLAEWESFTDEEINQMDRGALQFWKSHKAPLLMLAKNLLETRPLPNAEDRISGETT